MDHLRTLGDIKRYIIGEETADSTGKRHFHVYVEYCSKLNILNRDTFLVRGIGVNIEKPKSSKADIKRLYEYCSKDNNFEEFGKFDHFVGS